ncbi:MAG: hypothetical protein HC836_10530 [Richelia sp. RM2_1_2]|nr:hypothetical protein [Richelia sp. RM2_1_2]
MSSAVIYRTDTGQIVAEYSTMAAAKAAYTRAAKAKMLGEVLCFKGRYIVPHNDTYPSFSFMSREQWDREVDYEYIGSQGFKTRLSTPACNDPNTETYWSM